MTLEFLSRKLSTVHLVKYNLEWLHMANVLINTLIILIALEHIYFLVLEMFLWTRPFGLKTFGNQKVFAEQSKSLAANQGLYNGFLTAGLVWGLLHPQSEMGTQIKIFFLSCITVAGLYGAYSVTRRILFLQALPALLTLILIFVS